MNERSNLVSEAFRPRQNALTQSDVPATHPLVWVPLHDISVVDVHGADAKAFLQSKLTTNMDLLTTRGSAYGYATDINGRVLFDVHIAPHNETSFRLWSEPKSAQTIVDALDKYIIMEDVTLTVVDMPAAWMLVGTDDTTLRQCLSLPPSKAEASGYEQTPHGGVLQLARSVRPAYLVEGDAAALRETTREQNARNVTWNDWRAYEIAQGFVRTGLDLIPEQTIPLEAGEDLGVDYNKGCYLGQEVIERLRSRGTPNREYRRVELPDITDVSSVQAPADLVDANGRNAGTLTSFASYDGRSVGIAVIRRRQLQDEGAVVHLEAEDGPVVKRVGPVC